ncbi:MAG TPA: hypothetical protein VFC63_21950 [Blastocatellia bacterium]|nr:hypothetical protein [Blastocatellia bacterium]
MNKSIAILLTILACAIAASAQTVSLHQYLRKRPQPVFDSTAFYQAQPPEVKKRRQKLDWSKDHTRFNRFMHWMSLSLAIGGTAFDGIESTKINGDIQQTPHGVVVICEQNPAFKAADGCGFRQEKFFLIEGGVIGASEAIRTYFAAPADMVQITLGIVGLVNGFSGRSLVNSAPVIGKRK